MSQDKINISTPKSTITSSLNGNDGSVNERAISIRSDVAVGSSLRQRRVILTEEEYTSTLDNIISRDYYPALASLKRDAAILQKRAENDVPGAVAIRRAARAVQQHEDRLKQMEEEEEQEASKYGGFRSNPRPLHRESVDSFHTRVTSEDNEEFSRVTKQEERQKGELVLVTAVNDNDNLMLLKNGEVQTTNPFFFPPKLLPSSNQPYSKQQPTNTLLLKDKNDIDTLAMPPPDNRNKQNQITIASEKIEHPPQLTLVEYVAKASADNEIKIQPSQTRFPHQSKSRLIHASADRNYMQQIAIHDGDETTDLDEDDSSLFSLSKQKNERLQKERETFVCMTPQIVPNENNGSPITTWGEIASTPLVLSKGDELLEARKFDLPSPDSKDDKARQVEATLLKRSKMYKMANRQTKKQNRPSSQSLQPSMNKTSSSIRKGSNHFSVNARSGSAFGSALRASYSSSVTSHRSNSSRKRKHSTAHQPTPKLLPPSRRKVLDSATNVTDGLLNLT